MEEEHLNFGVVDNKLVWLTFEREFLQHIDLDELFIEGYEH